jgi:hypothetical protein
MEAFGEGYVEIWDGLLLFYIITHGSGYPPTYNRKNKT